jgi:hypothetical protein
MSIARSRAREAYRRFRDNPAHPSLRFKLVHATQPIYAARVRLGYRAWLWSMPTLPCGSGLGHMLNTINCFGLCDEVALSEATPARTALLLRAELTPDPLRASAPASILSPPIVST